MQFLVTAAMWRRMPYLAAHILIVLISPSAARAGLVSTFRFEGAVTHKLDTHDVGTPVSGFVTYGASVADTDPHPQVGIYPIEVEKLHVQIGGEEFTKTEFPAEIQVNDNYGCDCYFIGMPLSGSLGGKDLNFFSVALQNEFSPFPYVMIVGDSLPLSTPRTLYHTNRDFLWYSSNTQEFGVAELHSFSLTTVPEESSICLLVIASVGLWPLRRLPAR